MSDSNKNIKPDFLAKEIHTKGTESVADIYQKDPDVEEYVLHSKETYLNNDEAMEAFESSGIEDFDEFYDASKKRLDYLKSMERGVQISERAPVFENAINNFLGLEKTDVRATNRDARLEETDILKSFTMKEVAQEMGSMQENGLLDNTVDDSSWSVFTGDSNLRVAREIDPETNQFKFKTTEDGAFYLEEFDPSKTSHSQDQKLSVWNTGMWKDTWMDGNKVDEPLLAVALRKSPQLAAAALMFTPVGGAIAAGVTLVSLLPFLGDVVSGGAGLLKSMGSLTSDNEDADYGSINQFQNWLDRFNFDTSRDQQENAFGAKSILSNTADLLSQIRGMQAITKGSAQGLSFLTKGAGSRATNFAANQLGQLSMGISASEDFRKTALENGIDEDDASAMHLGLTVGLAKISSLTQMAFNPLDNKISKNVVNQIVKKELLPLASLAAKTGKPLSDKVKKNFVKKVVEKTVNTTKGLKELAQKGGGANAYAQAAFGATTEGIEEVSELGLEELTKSVYNKVNKEEKAGQGRFQDFNMDQFMRDAGHSFVYGALAGGIMGTSIGKKALGMKDEFDRKSILSYTLSQGKLKELKEGVKRMASPDTKNSYVKNSDGNYLPVDPEAVNPLQQISQHDMDVKMANAQIDYLDSHVKFKLGIDGKDGVDLKEVLDEQFQGTVSSDMTSMKEDIESAITQDIDISLKVDEIESTLDKLSPEEKKKAESKLKAYKEQQAEIDKNIEAIMSGKLASQYLHKAFFANQYKQNPSIDFETYQKSNEAILEQYNKTKLVQEEKLKEVEEIGEGITATEDIFKITEIANKNKGLLSPKAVEHIEALYESGKAKEQFAQRVIEYAIEGMETLQPGDQAAKEAVVARIQEIKENSKDISSMSRAISNNDIDENYINEDVSIFQSMSADARVELNDTLTEKDVLSEDKKKIGAFQVEGILEQFLRTEDGVSLGSLWESAKDIHTADAYKDIIKKITPRINHLKAVSGVYIPMSLSRPGEAIEESFPLMHEIDTSSEETTKENVLEVFQRQQLMEGMLTEMLKEAQTEYTKLIEAEKDPLDTSETSTLKFINSSVEGLDKFTTLLFDGKFSEYYQNQEAEVELNTLITELLNDYDQFDLENSTRKERSEFFDTYNRKYYQMMEKMQTILREINSSEVARQEYIKQTSPFFKVVQNADVLKNIRTAELINFSEAFSLMKGVIGDNPAPNWEQQQAIFNSYASLLSNMEGSYEDSLAAGVQDHIYENSSKNVGITEFKTMKKDNMYFLKGVAGSGKTSFVTGNVLKMLEAKMAEQDYDINVVATGHVPKKQDDYVEALKKKGVNVKELSGRVDHLKLIDMLLEGSEELANTGVITYDEATFIDGDSMKDFIKALEMYNSENRANSFPLQVVFVGDPEQVGAMMDVGGKVSSNHIGSPGVMYMASNTLLEETQRAGYLSLIGVQKQLQAQAKTNTNQIKGVTIETSFGTSSEGTPAGVEFVRDQDRKDASIKEMLEAEGEFYYVTDRNTKTDKEYQRLIKKFPELKAKTFSPISLVQGDEAEYVYYDISSTENSRDEATEKYFTTVMYMVMSRAKNKVAMTVTSNDRDWTSKGGVAQEKSSISISPLQYEEFREGMFSSIDYILEGLEGGEPQEVKKKDPKEEEQETEEDDLTEDEVPTDIDSLRQQYLDTLAEDEEATEEGFNEFVSELRESFGPKQQEKEPKKAKKKKSVTTFDKQGLRDSGYSIFEFKLPKGRKTYLVVSKPGETTQVLTQEGKSARTDVAAKVKDRLSNFKNFITTKIDKHINSSESVENAIELAKEYREAMTEYEATQGEEGFDMVKSIGEYIGRNKLKKTKNVEIDPAQEKYWVADKEGALSIQDVMEAVKAENPSLDEMYIIDEINSYLNTYESFNDFEERNQSETQELMDDLSDRLENIIGTPFPSNMDSLVHLEFELIRREKEITGQLEEAGNDIEFNSALQELIDTKDLYATVSEDRSYEEFKVMLSESVKTIQESIKEEKPEDVFQYVRDLIKNNPQLDYLDLGEDAESWRQLFDAVIYGKAMPKPMRIEEVMKGDPDSKVVDYLKRLTESEASLDEMLKELASKYKDYPHDYNKVAALVEKKVTKMRKAEEPKVTEDPVDGSSVFNDPSKKTEDKKLDPSTSIAIREAASNSNQSELLIQDAYVAENLRSNNMTALSRRRYLYKEGGGIQAVDPKSAPKLIEQGAVDVTSEMMLYFDSLDKTDNRKPSIVENSGTSTLAELREKYEKDSSVHISPSLVVIRDAAISQTTDKFGDKEGRTYAVIASSRGDLDKFEQALSKEQRMSKEDLAGLTFLPLNHKTHYLDDLISQIHRIAKSGSGISDRDVKILFNYKLDNQGRMKNSTPRAHLAYTLMKFSKSLPSGDFKSLLDTTIEVIDMKAKNLPKDVELFEYLSKSFYMLEAMDQGLYKRMISDFARRSRFGVMSSTVENNIRKKNGSEQISSRDLFTVYKSNVLDMNELLETENVSEIQVGAKYPFIARFQKMIENKVNSNKNLEEKQSDKTSQDNLTNDLKNELNSVFSNRIVELLYKAVNESSSDWTKEEKQEVRAAVREVKKNIKSTSFPTWNDLYSALKNC